MFLFWFIFCCSFVGFICESTLTYTYKNAQTEVEFKHDDDKKENSKGKHPRTRWYVYCRIHKVCACFACVYVFYIVWIIYLFIYSCWFRRIDDVVFVLMITTSNRIGLFSFEARNVIIVDHKICVFYLFIYFLVCYSFFFPEQFSAYRFYIFAVCMETALKGNTWKECK